MKKLTLVAGAALALVSNLALAQSTVTIYGILDGGISNVSGLKNGNSTAIVSGIMDGSRFGFKGSEDLGGGYKTIFTLENRFELDTGSVSNRPPSGAQLPDRLSSAEALGLSPTPTNVATVAAVSAGIGNTVGVNLAGNLFDRQAFVGLVTPFGAFTLGRQYTPAYLVGATFDASQTQSSLAAGQVGSFPPSFDIRLPNSLQYGIKVDGVTAALMYAPGEVTGNSSARRFYGAMAIYKGNGYSAGIGHNTRNNEFGQKSLTNTVLGATVDVGPGTLYGQFATIKDDNPTNLSFITNTDVLAAFNNAFKQNANLLHIGYKFTSGVNTWVVAYSKYDDKKAANSDTSSYGATYTYALSKRTSLNAVLVRFDNKGQAQSAPGQAGFLGGVTAAAGVGSTNVALGINHKF
ncbi:Outer membrane porin protein 32 [Polaromonas vacuolata]|uniref:Outer membrane porin protein 32 n=1 Tax=Polaromonas vacuolata TaxID=37448 RepID=A0A6H2HCS2_9BURK|nr:porin [Polaromonas vacuolata]QJC57630.1 Outer membrane porin protein 32 [Polaromonas vacuolata]